jgi:hypothetical protein
MHFPRVMVMPTLLNGALFIMVGVVPSGQIDSRAEDMSLRLGPVRDVRFKPDNNAFSARKFRKTTHFGQ